MGDTVGKSEPPGDSSKAPHGAAGNANQLSNPNSYDDAEGRKTFYTSPQPNVPQGFYSTLQPYPSQHNISQGRQEPFNLSSLGNTLPDASYQAYGNQAIHRYPAVHSPSPLLYPLQNAPYTNSSVNLPYNIQYQSQYPGYIPGATPSAANLQSGMGTSAQYYQVQGFGGQPAQSGSQFFIQPGQQYSPQGALYPGAAPGGQYSLRANMAGDIRIPSQQRGNDNQGGSLTSGNQRRTSNTASNSGQSSVVRGPPRKPRQSGHAIWIGNLPPQTDLMSLVLHVCKETSGLESLFLISKSNCAFANFKDEANCAAAQLKIHDSRFQTVRLVSRLRRSSVGTPAGLPVPTGPSALTLPSHPVVKTPSPDSETRRKETDGEMDGAGGIEDAKDNKDNKDTKDKFFIVKSLTVEDLELSVRNGIWATQSHNEETLNKAYQTADNVYLIFSANKSGEYFGYAKMISPINDDPAAAIEFAPKAQLVEDPELPKAIPTPATEFAPKGRIIDDSARGTIFWEAEREGMDDGEEEEEAGSSHSDQDPESSPSSQSWGKPFQVEWISTNRLPFYRTRGLRNPWNSNREVKIARDGTELETSIGRRLVALFHRLPSPVAPNVTGMPLPSVGIYPQMRPFP